MSRRVKEKGPVRKATAERFKTAPKELVRRGLDDGTERLKGQLRDNRDRERPQDYGSEKIEGGAERGAALAGRSVEAFLKHRKQELEREKSADTKESETGMPLESETTVEPSEAPPTADASEVPIPAESEGTEPVWESHNTGNYTRSLDNTQGAVAEYLEYSPEANKQTVGMNSVSLPKEKPDAAAIRQKPEQPIKAHAPTG